MGAGEPIGLAATGRVPVGFHRCPAIDCGRNRFGFSAKESPEPLEAAKSIKHIN